MVSVDLYSKSEFRLLVQSSKRTYIKKMVGLSSPETHISAEVGALGLPPQRGSGPHYGSGPQHGSGPHYGNNLADYLDSDLILPSEGEESDAPNELPEMNFENNPVTLTYQDTNVEKRYICFVAPPPRVTTIVAIITGVAYLYTGVYGILASYSITTAVAQILGVLALSIAVSHFSLFATVDLLEIPYADNVTLRRQAELLTLALYCIVLGVSVFDLFWLVTDCLTEGSVYPQAYCRQTVYGYAFGAQLVGLLTLTMRAKFSVISVLLTPFVVVGVRFAAPINANSNFALKALLLALCSIFAAVSLIARERFDRRRFEQFLTMKHHERIVAAHRRAIEMTLETLLPNNAITRLAKHELIIDRDRHCAISVMHVRDFQHWTTTERPNRIFRAIDALCCFFDSQLQAPLEKVAMRGDRYVVSIALRTAPDEAQEVLDASPIIEFALLQIQGCHRISARYFQSTPLQLQIGVSSGSCTGALVGHRLSYNVTGPAFREATEAAMLAPPNHVLVTLKAMTESTLRFSALPSAFLSTGERCLRVIRRELSNDHIVEGGLAQMPQASAWLVNSASGHLGSSNAGFSGSSAESPHAKSAVPQVCSTSRRASIKEVLSQVQCAFVEKPGEGNDDGGLVLDTGSSIGSEPTSSASDKAVLKPIALGLTSVFANRSLERDYRRQLLQGSNAEAALEFAAWVLCCALMTLPPMYQDVLDLAGSLLVAAAWPVAILKAVVRLRSSGTSLHYRLQIAANYVLITLLMLSWYFQNLNLSNGQMFPLFVFCCCGVYTSTPADFLAAMPQFVYATIVSCVLYGVKFSGYTTVIVEVVAFTTFFGAAFTLGSHNNDQRRRTLFRDQYLSEQLILQAEGEKKALKAILLRIVPTFAVEIVTKKSLESKSYTLRYLNDLVVLDLRFPGQPTPECESRSERTPRSPVVQMVPFEEPPRDCVPGILSNADVLDDVMRSLPMHHFVNLVELYGDEARLAGPLKEPRGFLNRNRTKSLKSATQMVRAEAPGMPLADAEWRRREKEELDSLQAGELCLTALLGIVRCVPNVTAIIGQGGAMGAVVGSKQPKFSIVGPVTRTTSGVLAAAPQGFRGCTATFLRLFEDYQNVPAIHKIGFQFDAPKTWAVRGVGSIAIAQLLPAAYPSKGPSVTSHTIPTASCSSENIVFAE